MSETTVTKSKPRTDADYEAIADQLLADMKRLDEQMQTDRDEIDFLKADTARLEAKNLVVLARLKAMW